MQQPNWKPGETTETARPEEIIMGTGRIKVRRNITRETRTTETGKQKGRWGAGEKGRGVTGR